MALSPNDQGVKFYGHVTASGNVSGSATGSFDYLKLNYDRMPTADPEIKGVIWRDSLDLKISAG